MGKVCIITLEEHVDSQQKQTCHTDMVRSLLRTLKCRLYWVWWPYQRLQRRYFVASFFKWSIYILLNTTRSIQRLRRDGIGSTFASIFDTFASKEEILEVSSAAWYRLRVVWPPKGWSKRSRVYILPWSLIPLLCWHGLLTNISARTASLPIAAIKKLSAARRDRPRLPRPFSTWRRRSQRIGYSCRKARLRMFFTSAPKNECAHQCWKLQYLQPRLQNWSGLKYIVKNFRV